MVKYFRNLGFIEALSLLILLFMAMPLKYFAQIPEAVRVVGTIHGILFLVYIATATFLSNKLGWSRRKLVFSYFVASLPFGPFIFDKELFPDRSAT